jgi:hypothetical protein
LELLESRTLLSVVTVDRLTDDNPSGGGQGGNGMGDLRWCVIESLFQADTIDFAVTGTISLNGILPTLNRNVSIEGPGADQLTVRRSTGGNYNIFLVGSGVTASISGVTIANGYAIGFGGGIYNSGILTLNESVVSGNLCAGGDDSFGGGIYNAGALTVSYSSVSGNTVIAPYGRGSHGGGIFNIGGLTVINSTIASNLVNNSGGAGNYGGGIDNTGGGRDRRE